MTVKIVLVNENGTSINELNVLSFNFSKDAYIPYTELNARFLTRTQTYPNTAEVKLFIDEQLIHHGLVDSIGTRYEKGKLIGTVSSRSFTSLLCRNQIEPGLKPGISLNSLMDNFYTIPYVTHENNSDVSNYIYVKKGTSMWDAVANLSYKLLGTYPYIRGTNTVMITPFTEPESYVYSASERLAVNYTYNYTRTASNYHMADIDGHYGEFELEDTSIAGKKIIRHEYSDLDYRFLYDPQQALEYRNKFDTRAMRSLSCEYCGYKGEDLFDAMNFSNDVIFRIMGINIRGDENGIITRITSYIDNFPKEL